MNRIPLCCRLPHRLCRLRLGALILMAFSAAAPAGEPRVVHLRPMEAPARFDGWGTSLCWFAHAVGQWPEPQRSEIADALFSPRGLNLTVVRYNIGGGENPAHHHMSWVRQMEGFKSATGVWNWNADAGQRWMLEAAIKRGAKRLEAFSNSPPYWMTVSQCASGASNGNADNLDAQHESAFVDYLTEVVKHFRDASGITFDTLDPLNEPNTDYWHTNGSQEGCHFDPASQARLIQRLRAALDQQGLSAVTISASDETNPTKAIETWTAFDAKTRGCIGQVNTHTYATDHRTELQKLIHESGKPLVMSEVDGGGNAKHDHASMVPALTLAGQIIDDLHYLRPLRWVFWQAVEDENGAIKGDHNWGLIHADLEGTTHAWSKTKKYYALAQFSSFIPAGAVLLESDASDTTAAYDRDRHVVVIVTRNSEPVDAPTIFDLASFGARALRVVAYRTSAKEDMAEVPVGAVTNGQLSATAPAQSITTYVVNVAAD